MKQEYTTWIESYEHDCWTHGHTVKGTCSSATEDMVDDFPELRRARGFVYCSAGRYQHWWCVTEDGDVVDPTASQFMLDEGHKLLYEELDDATVELIIPSGVCADCGGDVFHGDSFCSVECESNTIKYLNRELVVDVNE